MKTKTIVLWGTYDTGKPRVRILLDGLRRTLGDKAVQECHISVWEHVRDKSGIGFLQIVGIILRILLSYPVLAWRYFSLPRHRLVLAAYPGQLDVFPLRVLAWMKRIPVALDAFISAYDTVVIDRKLLGQGSIAARIIYAAERVAYRLPDILFTDTREQARYTELCFRLRRGSVGRVFVGAETEAFRELSPLQRSRKGHVRVLFYGQFIPLHGLEVIVGAAGITQQRRPDIRWTIIGEGQLQPAIDAMIEADNIKVIERIRWVAYEDLREWIRRSHVCLGIFGTTAKAGRVIPNKVYQILATGRPLITADTPAIRELLSPDRNIRLIAPGDPDVLASEVADVADGVGLNSKQDSPNLPVGPSQVGNQLVDILEQLTQC